MANQSRIHSELGVERIEGEFGCRNENRFDSPQRGGGLPCFFGFTRFVFFFFPFSLFINLFLEKKINK